VKLYLLDSNDAANSRRIEGITSDFMGGPELRLTQELLLGLADGAVSRARHQARRLSPQ